MMRNKVTAVFVAAVVLLLGVAWATTWGDEPDTTVPSSTSAGPGITVPDTASALTSPTADVPASAFGSLWVITSLRGVPLDGPVLPTFTFRPDDTILGWDGCNEYVVSAEGVEQTAAGCLDGVVPVMAAPPFTFDSEFELSGANFTAERFDRTDLEAAPLEGSYRFDGASTIRLDPSATDTRGTSGPLVVEGASCSISSGGLWSIDGAQLRFDLARPECAVGDDPGPSRFDEWLLQVVFPGVSISFHGGPAAGLWTEQDRRVTRLTRPTP